MANVTYLADSWGGVTWYRAHVPGVALKAAGHAVEIVDRIEPYHATDTDILVVQHPHQPAILRLVQHLRGRGATTVFDIDDDYWTIHPENPAAGFWTQERLGTMEAIARSASIVTTTTEELVGPMKRFNDRVVVLPNCLPDEHWPAHPKPCKPNGEPLVVGWAGSPGHAPDVRMVLPALTQVLEEFPNLEFHVAGLPSEARPEHPRISVLPVVKIEQYPELLAGFDIGLIPLVDNRFNRCKSDLKFLEYGMIGLPTIASKVAPYMRSVRHRENGLLATNTKDWIKHLRALVKDESLREHLGSNARAFAETRLISRHVHDWERAYGITTP